MEPIKTPMTNMSSITIHGLQPARSNAAEAVPVSAIMPATERSIHPLPERMTNVPPTAAINKNGDVMNKEKLAVPSSL